jgi:hypothetical protein
VSREQLPYFLLSCRELQIQSVQEIRIHSLAALSGQAQSTKTATATFEEVPRLLLRQIVPVESVLLPQLFLRNSCD